MTDPDVARVKEVFEQWAMYDAVVRNDYMRHAELCERARRLGGGVRPAAADRRSGFERFLAGDDMPFETPTSSTIWASIWPSRRSSGPAAMWRSGRDAQSWFAATWPMCSPRSRMARRTSLLASYSLHHFSTGRQIETDREVWRLLEPGGAFLWIDAVRDDGESRDSYIDRLTHAMSHDWTGLTVEQRERRRHHVRTSDFPETKSWMLEHVEAAGFRPAARCCRTNSSTAGHFSNLDQRSSQALCRQTGARWLRMQCVGENFERIDQPRAGAAEIGGAVDDVDATAADAGQIAPTGIAAKNRQVGERALDVEAAAGDDEHFRSGGDDLLPIDRTAIARRRRRQPPRRQQGAPVPDSNGRSKTADQSIRATTTRGRSSICLRASCDGSNASLQASRFLLRLRAPAAGRLTDQPQALEHIVETRRLEIDHPRLARQRASGGTNFLFSDGTHVAESLCHDQVRAAARSSVGMSSEYRARSVLSRSRTRMSISRLVAAAGMSVRVTFGNSRTEGGIVAFVRHADQLVLQAELADDLGRAGEQRDDSHSQWLVAQVRRRERRGCRSGDRRPRGFAPGNTTAAPRGRGPRAACRRCTAAPRRRRCESPAARGRARRSERGRSGEPSIARPVARRSR